MYDYRAQKQKGYGNDIFVTNRTRNHVSLPEISNLNQQNGNQKCRDTEQAEKSRRKSITDKAYFVRENKADRNKNRQNRKQDHNYLMTKGRYVILFRRRALLLRRVYLFRFGSGTFGHRFLCFRSGRTFSRSTVFLFFCHFFNLLKA